jgi:3-oxoadipate enol-lactonase
MPEVEVEGSRISYVVEGAADRPVLLLSNSLGTTIETWAPQVPELSRRFRLVRYDTRGVGRSGAAPGPYTIDRLGRDALAVLDAAGAGRAHVCGLSLGGQTAMWLAAHAPERVDRLVLAATAARIGTPPRWDQRIRDVRAQGMPAMAEAALPRWFSESFRRRHAGEVEGIRAMVAACPAEGYVGCCGALRESDLAGILGRIAAPTLVIAGVYDPVTPVEAAEMLRAHIRGAQRLVLEAAHLINVEQAEAFTDAVSTFLSA